ncbi:hypothetical protein QMT40_001778 [Parvibaculaceae bacterium PLY_AMNH_Bact1]|nr:hypothetical protein QMT40_001778 [Parvibaculaceae bacterium PLY_AMNH_Bact1]
MMNCIPGVDCNTCLSHEDIEQPIRLDFTTADGVAIVSMDIPKRNTLVPQHAHEYDHTSMLARGSVKAWKDGDLLGEFVAPCSIFIEANEKHAFLSLEDNTLIYCIHNTSRSGVIDIKEEHNLEGF